jgi:AsmA family protein
MPPAGSRARRIAIAGIGVLVAFVLLFAFFPWNLLRGTVASYASQRMHRAVAIEHLAVNLGWTTRVQLDGVTVGNASWSQTQPMATFPGMIFTFRVPSLFRLTPDTVRLVEPDVLLERNADGAANWNFEDGGGAGVHIGAIDVDRGVLRYRDATIPAAVDTNLHTVAATNDTPQTLQYAGKGTWRGEAFEIEGRSQGLTELRNVDAPYHLVLNARAGRTTVAFDGTVVPAKLENVKGALHIKGPDLSRLYPFVPSPLPWTPPYDLAGDLSHENAQWIFRGIKGTVGDSDLAGDFTIDQSSRRALTIADLSSRKFNYKDLGGFIGLPPGEPARAVKTGEQKQEQQKRAATYRVLPDKPFDLVKLRDHDVDLKFKGKSVKWGAVPIDNLSTHLTLKSGVMRFDPLDFGIADGHLVSDVTIDVTGRVPTAKAEIEARNLELKRIFPQLASPRGSAGRFGARAHFTTKGNSVAEMFAAADGEAAVAMRGGEASTLQLVLTNLDLARAAQLLIGGDEKAAISCAVAALHAKDGVMTPDLLVVDTEAELITGSGSIDFRNEKYDLHLKADSKKPSPLALKGPIVIGGTFGTPAIHPSLGPVIARIGAAVGLGVVAPPLALLPLIDLGDAPDADCRALYQDARLQTGTSERIARGSKATEKPQRAAEGERLAKSQKEAAASGQPN